MAIPRSERFWQQHVDVWRASGLTQKQYSKRHGLNAMTLANWSSVLQRRLRAKPGQALVPVRVVGEQVPASAIEVQRGALRLLVPVGTDPHWVAALLCELAAC
jgi:transposase-like protein